MTPAEDLVHEAMFAALKGDSALPPKLTDSEGRLGWFVGRIPGNFGLADKVAAVTVDAETARAAGDKEEVTVTLSVNAHRHGLAKDVAADLDRLFHPAGGMHWKRLALAEGHAGFIRREFADWSNAPDSELVRRTIRFRALVGRPRAA